MKASIDLEASEFRIGDDVFPIQQFKGPRGVYYKIYYTDKGIELGGFKIHPVNGKITGALTYHVDMVFTAYRLNNITLIRVSFGGKRYRMNKRKADGATINRLKKKEDKDKDKDKDKNENKE